MMLISDLQKVPFLQCDHGVQGVQRVQAYHSCHPYQQLHWNQKIPMSRRKPFGILCLHAEACPVISHFWAMLSEQNTPNYHTDSACQLLLLYGKEKHGHSAQGCQVLVFPQNWATLKLKNLVFNIRRKVIWDFNYMRVNKQWQNVYFSGNYSFMSCSINQRNWNQDFFSLLPTMSLLSLTFRNI